MIDTNSVISVIIPAGRSQEKAQELVERVYDESGPYILEIIVTSPGFFIKDAYNIHDEMIGSSRCIAEAYKKASGDIIVWLSDICVPKHKSIQNIIEFVGTDSFIAAEFRTTPPTTPGHYRICTILGKQYIRWGAASRSTIEKAGGFFDPIYKSHFGDVDLSLRIWKAGGYCTTCVDAVIELDGHWHLKDMEVLLQDEAKFLERWQHDYPSMTTHNTAEWNVDKELPLP